MLNNLETGHLLFCLYRSKDPLQLSSTFAAGGAKANLVPWASGSITGDLTPAGLHTNPQSGGDVAALHNKLDQLLAAYANTPRGGPTQPPSIFAPATATSATQAASAMPSSKTTFPVAAAALQSDQLPSAAAAASAQKGVGLSATRTADLPAATSASSAAATLPMSGSGGDAAVALPVRKAARSVSFAAPQDDASATSALSKAVTDASRPDNHPNDGLLTVASSSAGNASALSAGGAATQPSGAVISQHAQDSDLGIKFVSPVTVSTASASSGATSHAAPLAPSPAAAPKRRSILKTALGRMMK